MALARAPRRPQRTAHVSPPQAPAGERRVLGPSARPAGKSAEPLRQLRLPAGSDDARGAAAADRRAGLLPNTASLADRASLRQRDDEAVRRLRRAGGRGPARRPFPALALPAWQA